MNQFEQNNVWTLVTRREDCYINKPDESGVVVISKARLVAKEYSQEEGVDNNETFAPVALLEAIHLLLLTCVKMISNCFRRT